MPRGPSGQGCETSASSPRQQRRRTTSSAAPPPPAPSLRGPPPPGPSAILQLPSARGSCGGSGFLQKFSLPGSWAQGREAGREGSAGSCTSLRAPGLRRREQRAAGRCAWEKRLGFSRALGCPRWASGCCVVLVGAPPGRLEREPERSGSRGGERALAFAAAVAQRSVTLETPASPQGPGAGRLSSQPARFRALKERARHSRRWARTLPRARGWGCGAPARPSPPPLPLFRCSAAANHVPSVTQRL